MTEAKHARKRVRENRERCRQTEKKIDTLCPRNSDPFYVLTCYIKWVITSWTYSNYTKKARRRKIAMHRNDRQNILLEMRRRKEITLGIGRRHNG